MRRPTANEDFLLEQLDSDEGARRIGELGIGCNPGHHAAHEEHALRREDRRHDPPRARQRLSPRSAGRTRAPIHWDIVKDLRSGGRIELDGEVVQQDGDWLI